MLTDYTHVDLWSWRALELGGSGAPTAGSSQHKAERKPKKIHCWLHLLLNSESLSLLILLLWLQPLPLQTFLAQQSCLCGSLGQTLPVGSPSPRSHFSWTHYNIHSIFCLVGFFSLFSVQQYKISDRVYAVCCLPVEFLLLKVIESNSLTAFCFRGRILLFGLWINVCFKTQ